MKFDIELIVSTTIPTIEKLKENINGGNALLLYFDYIKHARIQKTNQPRLKDSFMIKSLKWGKDKFYNVKKILKDIGLIEEIRHRNEDGTLGDKYVKINFIINNSTTGRIIQTVDNPSDGENETNALSIKKEMLKEIKDKKREENKKAKNESKIKFLDFILLTTEQHDKLVRDYGRKTIDSYIEQVNNHIGSKGAKYKSHYHTIKGRLGRNSVFPFKDEYERHVYLRENEKKNTTQYKKEIGRDKFNELQRRYFIDMAKK